MHFQEKGEGEHRSWCCLMVYPSKQSSEMLFPGIGTLFQGDNDWILGVFLSVRKFVLPIVRQPVRLEIPDLQVHESLTWEQLLCAHHQLRGLRKWQKWERTPM